MPRVRDTRHRRVQRGTHRCPNTAHPPCRARLHCRWHTHRPPHLYHTTRIGEVPPPILFPPTPPSTLLSRLQPRRNPGTILRAPSSCGRGCIQPIPSSAPGYTFIPASVETYDYLAKLLVRYLNTLSEVAAAPGPAVTKGSFLAGALRELTVALIKYQGSM